MLHVNMLCVIDMLTCYVMRYRPLMRYRHQWKSFTDDSRC